MVFGGWFGSGNLGDDAILIGLKEIFGQVLPDAELAAFSSNPEYTSRVCGVEAIPLWGLRNILGRDGATKTTSYVDAFNRFDACVVSGGTPIYDYGHLTRSIYFGLPQLLGKKLVCFGIGAKPIESTKGRRLIKLLLKHAGLISARDGHSRELLAKLTSRQIRLTGDSSLFMKTIDDEAALRKLEESGIEVTRPMVAICPRALSLSYKTHYHEALSQEAISDIRSSIARVADHLAEKGFEVVFLPMHKSPKDDDLSEIRVVSRLMRNSCFKVVRGELLPQEVLSILGRMEIVVGLRLHSLILAAMQGVPVLSVDYDSKIGGFMELAGAERFLLNASDEPSDMMAKVDDALADQSELGRSLTHACELTRARIMEEAERVASYLRG